MSTDDHHPGESLECPSCRAVYLAWADARGIATQDEARCIGCGEVMTHWPQSVRFEMIESSNEAGVTGAPGVPIGWPSIRRIEEAVRLSRRRAQAASKSGT